jgi:hypothetical protein
MQRQQVLVASRLGATVGYSRVTLLRDAQGETIEFLVLTRWTSLAAIRAFAGEDLGRAVVEPEAVAARSVSMRRCGTTRWCRTSRTDGVGLTA